MAGGGGETRSTVTQSNLPEYAQPYYEGLMQRGIKESERDYQPYGGQRLAGQSAATQQGLQQMQNFAGTGPTQLNQAAGINNQVAQGALNAGNNFQTNNYQSQQIGFGQNGLNQVNAQNLAFGQGGIDRVNATQVGFGQNGLNQVSTGTFNGDAAQQYMSPYMDAVIGRAQENATRNFQIEESQRRLQQAKAGSFGGSRAAVQSQMATNAHQNNLTDLMVQGRQAAFENAQSQFNTDQGRALQAATQNQNTALTASQANQQALLDAARANQQTGLSMGQSNQTANLNAQTQNQNTALTASQANQKAALDAAQMREQSKQFGANLGLQGLELANQSAKQMTDLQGAYDSRALQQAQALLGVGQAREDYTQQQLDQSYNDFVNQRDSERQNLQFLSSLLQGVPVSANQDVQTSTGGGNNLAGALGSLGGLQALYALGKT